MLNDKVVLVTGGTGSFGKQFIKRIFSEFSPRKVIVYSRDELKQFEMAHCEPFATFNRENRIRFFIGDVRDAARHEEHDQILGFRRKMRLLRRERMAVVQRGGQGQIGPKRGSAHRQTRGASFEKMTSVDFEWLIHALQSTKTNSFEVSKVRAKLTHDCNSRRSSPSPSFSSSLE